MEIAPAPLPESNQPDPCDLFEPAELSSLLGQHLTETRYSTVACAWESPADSPSIASVSLTYDLADLAEVRGWYPDGQDVTVGGEPGFMYTAQLPDSSQAALSVDLGAETATLSIISPDPSFDAAGAATNLFDTAIQRGLTPGPEPSPGPSPCSFLTSEEVSAAMGLDVQFEALDYDTACSYFGGEGDQGIDVLVSAEDADTVGFAAEAVGATAIEGMGDEAWWSPDLDTLYARKGDSAFSVFVSSGGAELSPDRALELARGVMAALLAKV